MFLIVWYYLIKVYSYFSFISLLVWEPISVDTLFWGKSINSPGRCDGLKKNATNSQSLGNWG